MGSKWEEFETTIQSSGLVYFNFYIKLKQIYIYRYNVF